MKMVGATCSQHLADALSHGVMVCLLVCLHLHPWFVFTRQQLKVGQSAHTKPVSSLNLQLRKTLWRGDLLLKEFVAASLRSHFLLQMAKKSRLPHPSALMLLFITWRECVHCSEQFTVDPPEHVAVLDPGRLGYLEITWSPTSSVINSECSVLYQLQYFNTYKDRWEGIRTSETTYSAQFDLSKDIKLRLHTLLNGPCTNNVMIKSTNFTELIQKPPATGVIGTEVQDFTCVFYNMEYMECKWRRSPKAPADSQQSLYFWHKSLEKAVECPEYIISHGGRSGCNFTGKSLSHFTNINFCVNGSSPEGPLRPIFTTLQVQNQVKPAATEKLSLHTGPDKQLELNWEDPVGKVPGHCLEWELEHSQDGVDTKEISRKIPTKQTSLTISVSDSKERNCFRVRSKLHKYCVDRSFWSDWSHQVCDRSHQVFLPGNLPADVTPEPQWNMGPVYIYIAVAMVTVMMLVLLCVWAAVKMKKSTKDVDLMKKLSKLFALSAKDGNKGKTANII